MNEKMTKYVMYKETEQDENVARGYAKVIELLAYYPIGKKKDEDGNEIIIEKSRGPYFCQNCEDEHFFAEQNRDARIEKFTIQLLESTAIKYIENPENVKQFDRKESL